MTMQLRTFGVIAAFSLVAQTAVPEIIVWNIDGDKRQAIVYPPSVKSKNGKAPLLFVFHGHGDTMDHFQYTGMHLAYPEAIVAYFQGLPSRRDNLPGWQVEQGEDNDRDLKLVDAALASLRKMFRVDDARIYSTGFSNGAGFTYLLWAQRPGEFAAFAPIAGRIRTAVLPQQPRPLFHIAGLEDTRARFTDQREAIATARRVNGVTTSASCGTGCTLYSSRGGPPVMAWIHPGEHEIPQTAPDLIAKFFRDHPAGR